MPTRQAVADSSSIVPLHSIESGGAFKVLLAPVEMLLDACEDATFAELSFHVGRLREEARKKKKEMAAQMREAAMKTVHVSEAEGEMTARSVRSLSLSSSFDSSI
jgi:hypothetical protein